MRTPAPSIPSVDSSLFQCSQVEAGHLAAIDSPLPPSSLMQWFWRSMQHEGICVLIKAVCSADRYRPRPPTRFGWWRAAAQERCPPFKTLKRLRTGHGSCAEENQAVQSQEWQRSTGSSAATGVGFQRRQRPVQSPSKKHFCFTNWFDKSLLKPPPQFSWCCRKVINSSCMLIFLLQMCFWKPALTWENRSNNNPLPSNSVLLVYVLHTILRKPTSSRDMMNHVQWHNTDGRIQLSVVYL